MTRDDGTPCVVFAADEGFALPLAVAVRSLSEHLGGEKANVYVVDGGLAEATKTRLLSSWPENVEPRFVAADRERLDALPLSGDLRAAHISRSTYARLLVPDLLPRERKVLYLDADVLVLDDVRRLWNTSLDGRPVAAVRDGGSRFTPSPFGPPDHEGLGLRPDAEYFNAGVLLMDLDAWRREELGPTVLDLVASKAGSLRLNDQDALNAVLPGRWKRLDASWNVQVFGGNVLGEKRAAVNGWGEPVPPPGTGLLHFVTAQKPWKGGFVHDGYRNLYLGYQRQTAWAAV